MHLISRNTTDCVEKSVIKVQSSKFIDTGGGFLLEEKVGEELDDEPVRIVGTGVYHYKFTSSAACNKYSTAKSVTKKVAWLKCLNVTKAKEGISMDQPPPHLSQTLLQSCSQFVNMNVQQ